MKAGWWDTPLALRDLAIAVPIITGNGLSLLTENNFQTTPPLLLFGSLRLLIFRLSVGTPLLLSPPYYLELESMKAYDEHDWYFLKFISQLWSYMVCLSRPYHFKFFKDYLPQILFGSSLNTLTHFFYEVFAHPEKAVSHEKLVIYLL